MAPLSDDVELIRGIPAVPTILDVICRSTGMGFAAVARVTKDRWIACSVLDNIQFGLKPGGELELETTICDEIRESRVPVIIDHVDESECFRDHHTPRRYGFQSYISMPIILADGTFFGTLCSIDPRPARLSTPETIGMFKLFSELIAFNINAAEKLYGSEARLQSERETAELREQFIGVLGHDLRNPLAAISMGAALLREGPLDEEHVSTVDLIDKSVSRISGLIEDALDFTRGRLGGGIALNEVSGETIELVLEEVIGEARAIWPERALEVRVALTETVRHDRKRMAQLFTNLLSNAMLHGRKGGRVTVNAVSGDGRFEFSVSNPGNPIPPETLERMFEPFRQGDLGNPRKGLGLGLYIASEIAKSHGGTLSAASDERETRFTFTMPSTGML